MVRARCLEEVQYSAFLGMLAGDGEFGDLIRIGVEDTGSYGAGLTRHLAKAGVMILEVDRSDRRRKGKGDDLDAINAAARHCDGGQFADPVQKCCLGGGCWAL
jgi:transposase